VGSLLKAFFVFLYIMSAFYVIMVICLFRDQDLPIAIFKVTTKVIAKNLRMLFVPTLMAALIVGYILYWCYTFALLYTTPTLIIPTDYQQKKGLDYTDKGYIRLYELFFIFGLVWWTEIISTISKFSIMVGTANWYFKEDRMDFEKRWQIRPINGLWLALRYHFGSICLGSLVLGFIWPFTRLFQFLERHMLASVKGNTMVKTCLCCTQCCLDCFKRFIQVLNMNAYVQVALTGESFCLASVNAKALQLKSS
jgi:hypothetical protein